MQRREKLIEFFQRAFADQRYGAVKLLLHVEQRIADRFRNLDQLRQRLEFDETSVDIQEQRPLFAHLRQRSGFTKRHVVERPDDRVHSVTVAGAWECVFTGRYRVTASMTKKFSSSYKNKSRCPCGQRL